MRLLGSAYLVSPCSSAPFRWGRRSCLGLRTGVSPHFSMNSMREILALRGGYERGRIPLPSPMPPESGAPPHNTHPSMVPLSLSLSPPLSTLLCSCSRTIARAPSITDTPFRIVLLPFSSRIDLFSVISTDTDTTVYHKNIIQDYQTPRSLVMSS